MMADGNQQSASSYPVVGYAANGLPIFDAEFLGRLASIEECESGNPCGPDCVYCNPVPCWRCGRNIYANCQCESVESYTGSVEAKPSGRGNRERDAEIERRTGICGFCPRHDGENRKRRPRSDRHKDKRR